MLGLIIYLTKIVANSGVMCTKLAIMKHLAMLCTVVGATGSHTVANMWKEHFEKLYNLSTVTKYQAVFEEKVYFFHLEILLSWISWLPWLNRSVENLRDQIVFRWKSIFMEVRD